jgi:hypothetical protein
MRDQKLGIKALFSQRPTSKFSIIILVVKDGLEACLKALNLKWIKRISKT